MPRFNIYLLTTAIVWEGIEAPNAKNAEVNALSGDSTMDRILQQIEEPYRIVVKEVDDDDMIIEDEES